MDEVLEKAEKTLDKRYWLFAGEHYYPGGGFYDLVDSYSSVEEAVVEAQLIAEYVGTTYTHKKYDWYHIYDSQEKTLIPGT